MIIPGLLDDSPSLSPPGSLSPLRVPPLVPLILFCEIMLSRDESNSIGSVKKKLKNQ